MPSKKRKLDSPRYRSFRLQKRIKSDKPKLPNVIQLTKQTAQTLRRNKRFFIIFTVLYAVVTFILIQGGSLGVNINETKELLGDTLGGSLPTSLAIYAGLIGSGAQAGNQAGAAYQFIIVLMFSLAVIYGLRHMYGKEAKKVTVKESLYRGMTPLVPVILILMVLAIQLLPMSLGTGIYATVVNGGLAVTNIERIFWVLFVVLMSLLSLYLVSGSMSSLFIVTLPNMTPMRALRASRELVRHRRLEVIRKILWLPFVLIVGVGIVIVPFIAWLPVVAQILFYVIAAAVLPLSLTYLYNVYRSML